MKQIVLMRHAKSSWSDTSLSDKERPLNSRGKRDAPLIGTELVNRGIKPELLLVSSAERTKATAKKVASKLHIKTNEIELSDELYCATASEIEEIIKIAPEELSSIMIVAHNPGVTIFGNQIPGVSIDNVPTAGALLIAYDGTWSDFSITQSTLTDFIFPKQLSE